MNTAHLHLLVNHFPIIGTMITAIIYMTGIIKKNDLIKQTTLILLVLLSVAGFIAAQTGEAAEEAVEHIAGISHRVIHDHEEVAEKANFLHILTGIMSIVLLVLFYTKKKWNKVITILHIILLTATVAAMSYAGYTGGKIRHTEFDNTQPLPEQNVTGGGEENHID